MLYFLSKFRSTLLGTAKIDAAAKPFCVAKFLSKGRVAGCGTASHGLYAANLQTFFINNNAHCPRWNFGTVTVIIEENKCSVTVWAF